MGTPAWWSQTMPELVHRRELMQNVEKWQTMYVRYKCQPEAQVTSSGWDLSTSQRFADQLALEEQQPYLSEESLLYNGLAPTNIALRIVEAPAEFAVPVKQDRRLTPNFKVRVDVSYKHRCSFPLTLKAYVISQQEKDSVPEWVPDDFLDPDLPQRKPVTELKGTTVITHHFEATAGGSPKHGAKQQSQISSVLAGLDPSLLASMGLTGEGDTKILEQVLQESARTGNVDASTAAAIAAAAQLGGNSALDAISNALSGAAVEAQISHDYEFSSVELVKPTRMNKVYLVFACSILEQDLMFVVYNIPTVGICRAEQRAKACQKLGINFADLGGLDLFGDNPMGLPPPPRTMGLPNGASAATAAAVAAAQQQRKRGNRSVWGDAALLGSDGLAQQRPFGDGMMGLAGSDVNLAALAAGDMGMAAMGMGMQVENLMNGLGADGMGMLAEFQGMGAGQGLGVRGASGTGDALPRSRLALRELLLEEYGASGLIRKLSTLDIQSLESYAGFPIGSSDTTVTISEQQWEEFVGHYRSVLKVLRQMPNVWNLEDPCVIAGFDMDRLGTIQALALEPPGTFICRFSWSQPGSLVLSCKVASTHPNADADGLLHAIVKMEDLLERRVEVWIRDFTGATHILDVYKNKRVDKRKVFTNHYTRLRAMQPLDAYNDILI